ncbi:hypothetical protein EPYR_02493 [Erwinia pyrifoliae DSM 12163]|nr:hypothetical protein EPYR_02493 [Erwinia pyrifoliae DSM 12163]
MFSPKIGNITPSVPALADGAKALYQRQATCYQ